MPSHYATIERGYHYHSGPPSRQMMNGHGHHHPSQVVGMSNGHGGHVANGGMELHRNGGMELHRNGGMELHRNGGMEMHRNGGMELLRNGGMELLRNGGMELLRNGDSATMVSNKSKSKSSSKEEPGSSPFNTGIYRKKGHLNERAFSYSIRQEHRSRSYGSLANLQFANENGGPLLKPSGTPPHTAEGMKKEREIIQMIRDLDLSADDIERSQVPIDMYPSRKANGYRQQNGMGHHGPRITHR
ncbi:Translation factor GUF1, mitochondrial [Orchesella cincta]|uniref:Translation factor GUF1, mitochondrial n=1 Tax=Orchesella cincta TaxID=48709 RepID=A0A1D2N5G7_ORCCI|nr:Translation factor GUF1, mitochondrial [Orchesella cincta]